MGSGVCFRSVVVGRFATKRPTIAQALGYEDFGLSDHAISRRAAQCAGGRDELSSHFMVGSPPRSAISEPHGSPYLDHGHHDSTPLTQLARFQYVRTTPSRCAAQNDLA